MRIRNFTSIIKLLYATAARKVAYYFLNKSPNRFKMWDGILYERPFLTCKVYAN